MPAQGHRKPAHSRRDKQMTAKPQGEAKELLRQLNRIGNNLHQLQRHAHVIGPSVSECLTHVYARVDASLAQWATDAISIVLAPELITRLAHAGAVVNQLAHQANSRKPVAESDLLRALQDLTEKLQPVMR